MHDEITVERSLLYVQQHHVDQFKSIANKMKEFDYLLEEAAFSLNDAWNIAFNIWLLLYYDDQDDDIIPTVGKTLYYPSNFILIDALINQSYFIQLKKHNLSPEMLYIASLKLATGINQWINKLLYENNMVKLLNKMNHGSYFDAHLSSKDEVGKFSDDQTKFVKLTVKELHTSNSFYLMMKNCYEQVFQFYYDNIDSFPESVIKN
nr:hypothetical protein [Lysinibacillus timonensis]